jgi:predicted TIM-barrel fold metal-dependent hydrolase
MIVDVQRHWTPASYFEAHLGRKAFPRVEPTAAGFRLFFSAEETWDVSREHCSIDAHLAQLDADGVTVGIVSPAPIAVDLLPRQEAEEVCLSLNEEMAQAGSRTNGRLQGLATLPLQWPEAAVAVLRDAVERLGLRGVCVPATVGQRSLVEVDIAVVLAELADLGAVCFLHPVASRFGALLPRYALTPSAGFMFDTTTAAYELALSGILSNPRLPAIVHPHGGGTVPYLAERLDLYAEQRRALVGEQAPVRPSELLREMYTDTVCLGQKSLAMAGDFYGHDKLLFGSDAPYWAAAPQLELLRQQYKSSPTELDDVLGKTAASLLGLDTTTTKEN